MDDAILVVSRHRAALTEFDRAIRQVRRDQWTLPTPCSDWDVRALVNHVVGEALWTPPILAGRTVAEVGDAFDGDLLGDDPVSVWDRAMTEAAGAADADDVATTTVHLSFGDFPATEYLQQLTADYLVHAWDLAVAIGAEDRLDPDLVATTAAWFTNWADGYRSAGAIGAQAPVAAGGDAQDHLLATFGRDVAQARTIAAVDRFEAAFGRRDVDAVMAAMTKDCTFESTSPPDGQRHVGQEAVRAAWTEFFATPDEINFSTEERMVAGDRLVARWRYDWPGGHVRGIDVFRVEGTLVAEKASYVKG
jgi:uncharacterized protein (TIGR03086 family)